MKVLIVDDDVFMAEGLSEYLRARGFVTFIVTRKRWREAADDAAHLLREVLSIEDVFDALILDICFADNELGGAKCYGKLLVDGLRGKFRHLLIWTQWSSSSRESTEYQAVEVFRELSFAPPQNIVPKGRKDYDKVIDRLRMLVKEQHTPVGGL